MQIFKIFLRFKLILLVCLFTNIFGQVNSTKDLGQNSQEIIVKTIYGDTIVNEPVLIKIINDPWMQRLANIHQYGMDYYFFKDQDYNRFEHSLGVFWFLRVYGASEKEQIAGLLHDISHTAFSHLADYVYRECDGTNSYQDDIHESFLNKTSIKDILAEYGYSVKDIIHKNNEFKALEQDLPNLCADRIEYNLYGCYIDNVLTLKDIKEIISDLYLNLETKTWYFKSLDSARKFSLGSLYLTATRWATRDNLFRNYCGSFLIKEALNAKLISHDEFKYGTDDNIWQKLNLSKNNKIKDLISDLYNAPILANLQPFRYLPKAKFRGVDPLVLVDNNYKRLSEIDPEYKIKFEEVKNSIDYFGYYLPTQNSLNIISSPTSLTDFPVSSLSPSSASIR